MLRIKALPNSFLPHSLSIVPTSKFAGRPPLTMLTGSHCGSCSPRSFWLLKTLLQQSDGTETHYLWTDLGILDKQHKLYVFRVYSWSGWHLRSCSLAAHALPHALLAFAFSSAGLQKQRGMLRGCTGFKQGICFDVKLDIQQANELACSCSLRLCGSRWHSFVIEIWVPVNAACCSLLHSK